MTDYLMDDLCDLGISTPLTREERAEEMTQLIERSKDVVDAEGALRFWARDRATHERGEGCP